jgi:hypothetical protein
MKTLGKILIYAIVLPCIILHCCEKDNSFSDTIVGKWKWIYSIGGIAGHYYPSEGNQHVINITQDSIIYSVNGVVSLRYTYSLSENLLKYSDSEFLYRVKISKDTLRIHFISDTLGYHVDDGIIDQYYLRL